MVNQLVSIPIHSVPQFDELHVISDLHLGGPADFQIFNSGVELAGLIEHLRGQPAKRKIALLINGDFVDFLAEQPARHFDPEGAVGKLQRIATEDEAFKPVFEKLKGFAGTENRHLIINLGNHDLELALPWVSAYLLELLSGDDEAARGRITFSFEGTGFLCRIGNAQVLCVHGNEVDTWNVADYERIRRFGREILFGRPVKSWIPNAGTRLVIDVMNDIKRRFPFVDLLKPEQAAVLPILAALAPDQRDKLQAAAATVSQLGRDYFRQVTGLLGAGAEDAAGALIARDESFPGARFGLDTWTEDGYPGFDRQAYADALLDAAEDRLRRDVEPMSLLGRDQQGAYLGVTDAIVSLFRREEKSEVLRVALEYLRKDRSFDWSAEDATFTNLDAQIGTNIDFLISGHTHLERALPRTKGHGWYFNSGTWARLIRLEDRVLDSKQAFKQVFEVFKQGKMEALDGLAGLVIRRLTVVSIWRADDGSTQGELRRVKPLSDEEKDWELSSVAGTSFTKS